MAVLTGGPCGPRCPIGPGRPRLPCTWGGRIKTHVISMANHVISLTDHVLSLTDHVLSLTDHVILMANHVISLTDHVISLTNHVILMANHVISLTDHVILWLVDYVILVDWSCDTNAPLFQAIQVALVHQANL